MKLFQDSALVKQGFLHFTQGRSAIHVFDSDDADADVFKSPINFLQRAKVLKKISWLLLLLVVIRRLWLLLWSSNYFMTAGVPSHQRRRLCHYLANPARILQEKDHDPQRSFRYCTYQLFSNCIHCSSSVISQQTLRPGSLIHISFCFRWRDAWGTVQIC